MFALFAQKGKDADAAGALGGIMVCFGTFGIVFLVVILLVFAIMWKVFTKAGQPGWAALVPIYNHYLLVMEICKLEILWFILGFIPIGNIIAGWVICQALAKKFGKSDAFGIGLFFLGFGRLGAFDFRMVHDLDIEVAQLGVKLVQIIRREAIGQNVIDIIVGDMAMLMRKMKQSLNRFGQINGLAGFSGSRSAMAARVCCLGLGSGGWGSSGWFYDAVLDLLRR